MENSLYKKYQSKFNLPELKDMKRDFSIKLENKDTVLVDILDSMFNKISSITESFEGVMTGEGFSSVFEASMLSISDKDQVFKIYKNMKSLLWDARLAISQGNEKQMASVIKNTYDTWSNNADQIADICKKLSEGWKNLDVSKISDTIYHG